jgi:hypothetical protein
MSTPLEPTIIAGPAVVDHNGAFIYFQSDLSVKYDRQSFKVASAYGTRDERHKSLKVTITGTPVGELRSTAYVAKLYPYTPADIGKSIFKSPALNVWSIAEGKKYAFPRCGISKFPKMYLCPTKTAFGDMEWTGIQKVATAPTDAAYIRAISSTAFADTSFDDDSIITDIYQATLGAREDTMGAIEGFEIEPTVEVEEIAAADKGIGDIRIKDLWLNVRFAPSNLSEDQVDELLAIQGSDVVLPGQSYAKAAEDLVIDSDAFTFTGYQMGAKDIEFVFGATQHRHKGLLFTPKRYGSISAASSSPLWLMTVN